MIKRLFLILTISISLFACPFDEDDNDPTVDSYLGIEQAINKNDYAQALAITKKWKELYVYFEDTYNEPINTKLLESIENKDNKKIMYWLNRSMVIEIKELIDLAQKSISNYSEARIKLVKAKNHLKVTNKKLSSVEAKESKKLLRKLLKTLGNPGMFGVGKKPMSLEKFELVEAKINLILDKNFN